MSANRLDQAVADLLHKAADEIDRLRARLAEAEANCTASMAGMERAMERAFARAEAAESRLAAVLALCDEATDVTKHYALPKFAARVRAAARGEGDR